MKFFKTNQGIKNLSPEKSLELAGTQPGIEDVVTVDRQYHEPRISWFSGSPAGYGGTARNDLGGV